MKIGQIGDDEMRKMNRIYMGEDMRGDGDDMILMVVLVIKMVVTTLQYTTVHYSTSTLQYRRICLVINKPP